MAAAAAAAAAPAPAAPASAASASFGNSRHRSSTSSRIVKCSAGGSRSRSSSSSSSSKGRFYWNVTGFPFPLGPFLGRATIRKEIVKGSIWTFEQEQALGFSSVSTNIRMTVIKLSSGGLWVHAPVAPTKECVQLLQDLEAPVEYIVLPTFAYEHKVYVGPFSRSFPGAQVWVAPSQWSWPLNLPLEFFGIFFSKTLPQDNSLVPWAAELEHKILSSLEIGIGPYVEVAFYHRKSRTLLVTDAVIYVPEQPPEVISKKTLLASAGNGLAVKLLSKGKEVPAETIVDNEFNKQRGWERMVLLILFLGPSNLLEPRSSFAQVSKKLIVSPIVKTLVYSKIPEQVRDWVEAIASDWKFRRIIPAHFAAPVSAGPQAFRAAFSFVERRLPLLDVLAGIWDRAGSVFSAEDMKTLSSLDRFLVSVGAVKETVSSQD